LLAEGAIHFTSTRDCIEQLKRVQDKAFNFHWRSTDGIRSTSTVNARCVREVGS